MEIGLKYSFEQKVTMEMSAKAFGSGTVEVLATPMMIALMEKAAMLCVKPHLEEGMDTVGTIVNVNHTAATPVGDIVKTEAILTAVDGRKLVFTVEVFDSHGKVGEGTHERFIIDVKKFMARVNAKLEK